MRILVPLLFAAAVSAEAPKPITDAQQLEVKTLEASYWQLQAQIAQLQLKAAQVATEASQKIEALKTSCEKSGGKFTTDKTLKCEAK